ncbi:MAG: VacJ [Pseudogulbenkiania sp.]|nr:VacJ [Pseudogulbenkiania sp.]
MYEVNRSVAIIRPRAPFLDWLKQLPGELNDNVTLESLTRDCNALLIPCADDYDAAEQAVLEQYQSLFQAELADWCDDESLWPAPLTLELFQEWFQLEIHSVLSDIVDEPLERAHFEPFEIGPDA